MVFYAMWSMNSHVVPDQAADQAVISLKDDTFSLGNTFVGSLQMKVTGLGNQGLGFTQAPSRVLGQLLLDNWFLKVGVLGMESGAFWPMN